MAVVVVVIVVDDVIIHSLSLFSWLSTPIYFLISKYCSLVVTVVAITYYD